MGLNPPLLLVRAASVVCAWLLLFAVFSARAHAQDDYGLAPLPPAQGTVAAPAMLPAPSDGSAPQSATPQPAPPAGTSSSDGFAPVPASTAMAAPSPAPQLTGPVSARPYGFNPGDGAGPTTPTMPQMPAAATAPMRGPLPQPASTPLLRQAEADTTPYGYKPGDGGSAVALAAGPTHMATGPARMAGGPAYAAYQPADNAPRFNSDYVLGAGDKLRLTVFDENDLSGEYAIDGSGYVRLPLIGQVRAAGYTSAQLEGAIGSALANGYLRSPRVSVEVSTYRPFYIIGAVNRPGEYPYVDHMNALNAVALAGGFLPSAKESTLYVRPQGSNQEYRVPADAATLIHPGDVVRVDTTVFWDTMSLFSPLTGVAGMAAAGIR